MFISEKVLELAINSLMNKYYVWIIVAKAVFKKREETSSSVVSRSINR